MCGYDIGKDENLHVVLIEDKHHPFYPWMIVCENCYQTIPNEDEELAQFGKLIEQALENLKDKIDKKS